MLNIIKFPVTGPNSIAVETLPNGARFYTMFARPDANHPLSQIPEGPNPRDVDSDAAIPKKIFNSYLNDELFSIKNRGMRAIIDESSMNIFEDEESPTGWYAAFACESFCSGQYDGGHSANRTDSAIVHEDAPSPKAVAMHLTENTAFATKRDIRNVAKAINAVQKQQSKSEINILGGFDTVKNNLTYCSENHIGWKQNQRLKNGEKVPNELGAAQVTCLLGTILPSFFVKGVGIGEVSGWPKKGRETLSNYWDHETKKVWLNAASEHIDIVLEFADFVQTEMSTILGESIDTYGILHKTMNGHIDKAIEDRPAHCNYIFKTAQSVEHTLTKELLNTVCYSVLNHVFSPDDGRLVTDYTIGDLKAIWRACGKQILDKIEGRFRSDFQAVFNNRWGDFVADESMWALCSTTAQRTVFDRASWKKFRT